MSKMAAVAALILATFAFAAPAHAADEEGRFMIKGVGGKTCEDLLRANGVTREQLDIFLDGFVTAINIDRKDTYDIVPGAEWDRALEGIVAYCGANRSDPIALAAYRMIEHFFPKRLKTAPSR